MKHACLAAGLLALLALALGVVVLAPRLPALLGEEPRLCTAACGLLPLNGSADAGLAALPGRGVSLHALAGCSGLVAVHHGRGLARALAVEGLGCPAALSPFGDDRVFAVDGDAVRLLAVEGAADDPGALALSVARSWSWASPGPAADVAARGPDAAVAAVPGAGGGVLELRADGSTSLLEAVVDAVGVAVAGDGAVVASSGDQLVVLGDRAIPVGAAPGRLSTAPDGAVWAAAGWAALRLDPARRRVVTALSEPGVAPVRDVAAVSADAVFAGGAHCALRFPGGDGVGDGPLRWTAEDPSASASVSLTAFGTGHVFVQHGLAPPSFYTPTGHALYAPLGALSTALGALGLDTLDGALVARHRWLDARLEAAVAAGRVGQVLELAAGLSGRGVRFAPRVAAYVETDLPGMLSRKRAAVGCVPGGRAPTHHLAELDVLDADALARVVAAHLRPGVGTAIVAEGLYTYFPPATVEAIWRRLLAAVRELGGGGLVMGTIVTERGSNNPLATPFRHVIGAVTGTRMEHYEDSAAVREALERVGFAEVEVDTAAILTLFSAEVGLSARGGG